MSELITLTADIVSAFAGNGAAVAIVEQLAVAGAVLRREHPAYPFQFEIQRDPRWVVFSDLVRLNDA